MGLQPTGSAEHRRLLTISRLINHLAPPNVAVYDIGGGDGNLFRYLRPDLQGEYTVVDSQPFGQGRRLQGDITQLDLENLPVVALSDVLEHIDDDVTFLRKLVTRLAPRGILALHVPALRRSRFSTLELERERAELEDHQDHPHQRDGYTRSQLEEILGSIAPNAVVQVLPSHTDWQSLISDADWLLWRKRLTPLRPLPYVAGRLSKGIEWDMSSRRTAGWAALVAMPARPI